MPYKSKQHVGFNDGFCENLSIDQTISDGDYAKIPPEYQDSWKFVVDKPTHNILFEEGCVYKCMSIGFDSTRHDDIKNWFAKKI